MEIPGILQLGRVAFGIGLSGEGEVIVIGEVIALFEKVVLHVQQIVEYLVYLLIHLIVNKSLLRLEGNQTFII